MPIHEALVTTKLARLVKGENEQANSDGEEADRNQRPSTPDVGCAALARFATDAAFLRIDI